MILLNYNHVLNVMLYSIAREGALRATGFMNINLNVKRDRNIMVRDFFLKRFKESKILHHLLKMAFLTS
jgi:hypothetical protein